MTNRSTMTFSLEQARACVETLSTRAGEPVWLRERRLEAAAHFVALPLPSFRQGLVGLRAETDPFFTVDPQAQSSQDLAAFGPSGTPIRLLSLVDACTDAVLGPFLEREALRLFPSPEDRWAAFHMAFYGSGWVLHIPDDVDVQTPVHVALPVNGPLAACHLIIVAGARSRATVTVESMGTPGVQFLGIEGFVQEGASLSLASLHDAPTQVWQSDLHRFRVERDAHLSYVSGLLGGQVSHVSAHATLAGPGAEAHLSGCYVGVAEEAFDLAFTAVHQAPSSTSRILATGVLGGTAQATMHSRTQIAQTAPGSDARQDLRTLLLSPGAHASPIPELEIQNSDVRCGHAASTGRLKPEELFYAMSRGLSSQEAVRLLTEGHLERAVSAIADPLFREPFQESLTERLVSLSSS